MSLAGGNLDLRQPTRTSTATSIRQRDNSNDLLRNATTARLAPTSSRASQRATTRQISRQPTQSKQPEIRPEYYFLNPWYGQPNVRPIFGLGEPLPHTVRRPMKKIIKLRPQLTRDGQGGEGSQYGEEYLEEEGEQEPDLERGEGDGQLERQHSRGREEGKAKDDGSRLRHISEEGIESDLAARSAKEDTDATAPEGEGLKSDKPRRQQPPDVIKVQIDGQQRDMTRLTSKNVQDFALPQSKGGRVQPRDIARFPGAFYNRQFREDDTISPDDLYSRANTDSTDATKMDTKQGEERKEYLESESEESPKEQVEVQQQEYDQFRNRWGRTRARYSQPLAEFLGTTIVNFLGLAANLAAKTGGDGYNTHESQCWAWGFSVMIGIYLAGGVSGAHLNPAISITLATWRGFPWRHCLSYVIAQLLGGLAAGGLAYLLYRDAIQHTDPGLTPELTGAALYTLPQPFISATTAFFSEFAAAAILVCAVFALGDDQNSPPGAGMNALILGLLVVVLMLTMGLNTGPALNPARDFGPRLVALWAGYGRQTFTDAWWVWGPWVATISGASVGAAVYDTFIFVGAESPVNFIWPTRGELVGRIRGRKREVGAKVRRRKRGVVGEKGGR